MRYYRSGTARRSGDILIITYYVRQIVDLFAGIEAGVIEARVIPRHEKHVNLLLENKTQEPVVVSIPAALAAVPLMAQFDFPWLDNNQGPDRQQPQTIGMTPQRQNFPGPGAGPMNFLGPGLLSVPPEKVVRVGLTGVCLNHGHPTPRPKLPYELRRIEEVASRPEVAAICIMLGQGEIDQATAQLAAWHFHSEMSWDDLAALRSKTAIGAVAAYSRKQLRSAKKAAKQAKQLAAEMQPSQSSVSLR